MASRQVQKAKSRTGSAQKTTQSANRVARKIDNRSVRDGKSAAKATGKAAAAPTAVRKTAVSAKKAVAAKSKPEFVAKRSAPTRSAKGAGKTTNAAKPPKGGRAAVRAGSGEGSVRQLSATNGKSASGVANGVRHAASEVRGVLELVAEPVNGATAKQKSQRMGGGTVKATSNVPAPRSRSNGSDGSSIAIGSRPGGDKVKAIDTSKSGTKSGEAGSSGSKLPTGYRPSDSEPFMNERQRLYFRHKLIAWKEEIVRQNRETLQGLHEDSAQHADVADRATFETDRALELRARDRQRKLIAKIDAALARIEEGTYGYCEETGEPISLKRLEARPIATLSIEAQERHERRERVFREE
jgi:DnaK suppressor protein